MWGPPPYGPPPYPYAPPPYAPPSYPYAPPPYGPPPYPYAPPPPANGAPPVAGPNPYPRVASLAQDDAPASASPPPYMPPPMPQPSSAPPYSPPPSSAPPYGPPPIPPPTSAPPYAPPPTSGVPHGPPPTGPHKKALLIGCSYRGTSNALQGCINDVKCLRHLLITKFGYKESNIVMLEDTQMHPDFLPTRMNIMRGIYWLLMDNRPGTYLFFSFSGHGSQVKDYDGDELNGLDETIIPCDYKMAGQITDDELNDRLIKPVMPGVTLNCIVDACHSGSVLDLQYHGVNKPGKPFVWKKGRMERYKSTSGGLVFSFSACKDSQVAADTNSMSGTAHTGAATYAFIQAVEAGGPYQSYGQVLQRMHSSLEKLGGRSPLSGKGGELIGGILSMVADIDVPVGGGQTPVLSCNQPLNADATPLMI